MCSFSVTVNDTQKPTITCTANITMPLAHPGDTTAPVNFKTPAGADNCAIKRVVCTPASGSAFSVGVMNVSCTATDTSNNTATCGFTVSVPSPFDSCLQDDVNGDVFQF